LLPENHEYEVLRLLVVSYPSTCIADDRHRIRPGDKAARLQRADNPMWPVPGLVCYKCAKGMRRAVA
jgi:hypothetical protein